MRRGLVQMGLLCANRVESIAQLVGWTMETRDSPKKTDIFGVRIDFDAENRGAKWARCKDLDYLFLEDSQSFAQLLRCPLY